MNFTKYTLAALAICGAASAFAEPYKVIFPVPAEYTGALVNLSNYDSGEKIDSAYVVGQTVVFEGDIADATLARMTINGARTPIFILEPGTISFDEKTGAAFGSMLNDKLREYGLKVDSFREQYEASESDEARQGVLDAYKVFVDKTIAENSDNLVGYYVFISENAYELDAAGLRDAFSKNPYFGSFERSKSLLAGAERREATGPGNKFIDFAVTQPDGRVKRLSDYAGKGKFVLVDFWASWCGPCIRQTAVLKDIYNKYKDSGRLEVLGVAVWDEVEATQKAIARHKLPWECILDANSIPTDIYGITGIPCIMLIGPDGTILSRDKQDNDLRNDVDAALAQ